MATYKIMISFTNGAVFKSLGVKSYVGPMSFELIISNNEYKINNKYENGNNFDAYSRRYLEQIIAASP
ncbi:hypothetical protein N9Z16_04120 [Methylophilaceae bacterium]|nr:hypothetical protein [Methylophilaceae bacterium]